MQARRLTIAAALAVGALVYSHALGHAGTSTARDDFLLLCADCHNRDARGNGPLAKELTKKPPDLTRIKQRAQGKFDEKAVYDWILGLNMTEAHGTREMPVWGDWLMDEAMGNDTSLAGAKAAEQQVERRVMGIVRYLESLQTED